MATEAITPPAFTRKTNPAESKIISSIEIFFKPNE